MNSLYTGYMLLITLGMLTFSFLIGRAVWNIRKKNMEKEDYFRTLTRDLIHECDERRKKLEIGQRSEFIYPVFDRFKQLTVWARMRISKRSVSGNIECSDAVDGNGLEHVRQIRSMLVQAGINTVLVMNVGKPPSRDEIGLPNGGKIDQFV